MPGVSFIPRTYPLELYAGDGVELRLTVGGVAALDGEVFAEIRQNRDDDAARDAFTAAVTGNVVTLTLTGAQTAGLGAFRGAWDCEWRAPDREPLTLVQGPITC